LALFPPREAWLLAVLAIIVVPVDLAPAVAIVRDPRVPTRLREIMNVEAGLNDGLAAPLFLFCLAGATATHTPAVEALENAVPAILIAVGVGGAIGLAGGVSLGWSWPIRWRSRSGVTASWRRSPRACCSPPAIAASRRRRCTPPRT
jgi:NhaP-type Na+/H+ or K+/H+ antiporter